MALKPYCPYLLVALACFACLAISCSSDSSDDPVVIEGREVTFEVKDLTRATAATSFDRFAVYGDMKYTKVSDSEPTVTFNKTTVERTDGIWTYQDVQYWYPDHEHSFVAISPLSVLETDNDPRYSDSRLSFIYALPLSDGGMVNDNEVVDIVAATYRRLHTQSSAASPVSLNFFHLLSQINFSLELTERTTRSEGCFKIHKLEMSGFGTSTSISIKPASIQSNSQTDDSEIEIVTAKGNGSLEIGFDVPIEVIKGAGSVKMFDSDNAILLLPQTFAADDKVRILLTYSADDEEETAEVSAALSDFKWESGKSYNYKIKLELEEKEANMVISGATIAPWNLIENPDHVDAK